RVCSKDHVNGALYLSAFDAGMPHPIVHRHLEQDLTDLFESERVSVEKISVLTTTMQNQGEYRTQEERIRPGTDLEMEIRHLSHFRAARVDDQQLAVRVFFNLIDEVARVAEAVREPRITADHHQQIAVLNVLAGVCRLGAKEQPIDPEVASLFLREGIIV